MNMFVALAGILAALPLMVIGAWAMFGNDEISGRVAGVGLLTVMTLLIGGLVYTGLVPTDGNAGSDDDCAMASVR